MQDELPTGADGAEPPEPDIIGGVPALPSEVTAKEEEVRRLIDAGASSPEELRALAAKLQERRTHEEEVWRREVRPALMQSKKRRGGVVSASEPRTSDRDALKLGALVVGGMVVLLVLAAQTSMWLLVLPVIGVLVYAWVHGRRTGDGAAAPPQDATD